MADNPSSTPTPDGGGDALGSDAARVAGERLRELSEAEAARVEAEEAAERDAGEHADEPGAEHDVEAPAAVCPFCEGYGRVDADALLDALPQIVARIQPFKQSPRYTECLECDGWGTILTGARLPEQAIAPCPNCNGAGFVASEAALAAGAPSPVPLRSSDEPPAPAGHDPLRTPPPAGAPPAPGMSWNAQTGYWEYAQVGGLVA